LRGGVLEGDSGLEGVLVVFAIRTVDAGEVFAFHLKIGGIRLAVVDEVGGDTGASHEVVCGFHVQFATVVGAVLLRGNTSHGDDRIDILVHVVVALDVLDTIEEEAAAELNDNVVIGLLVIGITGGVNIVRERRQVLVPLDL
jgi:hypothetical protein